MVIGITFDVVIIGGGIAGLSCGALLSKEGYRVLLLEAKPIIGGRANSQVLHSGYIVDWGIHSLRAGDAGVAATVFQKLGLELDIVLSGEGQLFHEGAWYSLPTSVSALMATPLLNDADRSAIGTLFAGLMSAKPEDLLTTSVATWLAAFEVSETIRWIFQLYAGLILIEPDVNVASMGEMLDIMHTILRSGKAAGYPKGGWKVLLQALQKQIEDAGEIRLKQSVNKIHIQDGTVKAVQTGNDRIPCDSVIAAVPPNALSPLLPETDSDCKKIIKLAQQLIPTAGVSLDLGFAKPITDAPGLIVSSNPFIMGQATSNIDPSVAPSGEQLLTFYYPIPAKEIQKDPSASKALKQLEIVVRRMFPKAPKPKWTRRLVLPMVDGAAPRINQNRNQRLPIQTSIKGLYLAGDAHNAPGAGGDIAFNAALACTAKITLTLD
jgi:all-trans-retinol 13,14-reductase